MINDYNDYHLDDNHYHMLHILSLKLLCVFSLLKGWIKLIILKFTV